MRINLKPHKKEKQRVAPSRHEKIMRDAEMDALEADFNKEKGGRKIRKRSKMPFRLRVLLFAAVLGVILGAYTLSFIWGNPVGAAINNFTDSMMKAGIDGICGFFGAVLHSDWSGKAIALKRLLTLGPFSFVLFATLIALIVSGIVAAVWSGFATSHSRDDGTSNFKKEPRSQII